MMWGVDPRALSSGDVVDRNGDTPDLSDEERQLTSAIRAGELARPPNGASAAFDRDCHVRLASLIEWFRAHGYAELAHDLERAGATGISAVDAEAKRRLASLRALGGNCTYDTMSGKWKIFRLSKLKAEEDARGVGRTSEKTLRRDLIAAAEAERETHRAEAPRPHGAAGA